MPSLPCLTAVLVLASGLAAQVTPHRRVIPKGLSGVFAGQNCRTFHGNAADRVMQLWYRGDLPKGFRINAIATRQSSLGGSQPFSYDTEIIFDNTTLGFGGLSKTLSKNLSANKTTVFKGKYNVTARRNAISDPNLTTPFFKFTRPFVFKGPNLIFQLSQINRKGGVTNIDCRVQNTDSVHTSSLPSCTSRRSLTAQWNAPNGYQLNLFFAPPSSTVLFLIGVENVQVGNQRLPIDLSVLGMKDLGLGVLPIFLVSASADVRGTARVTFPLPLPTDSLVLIAQAVHATNRNAAGLATTNTVTSIIGKSGLANFIQLQNNTVSGPNTVNVIIPFFVQ